VVCLAELKCSGGVILATIKPIGQLQKIGLSSEKIAEFEKRVQGDFSPERTAELVRVQKMLEKLPKPEIHDK